MEAHDSYQWVTRLAAVPPKTTGGRSDRDRGEVAGKITVGHHCF